MKLTAVLFLVVDSFTVPLFFYFQSTRAIIVDMCLLQGGLLILLGVGQTRLYEPPDSYLPGRFRTAAKRINKTGLSINHSIDHSMSIPHSLRSIKQNKRNPKWLNKNLITYVHKKAGMQLFLRSADFLFFNSVLPFKIEKILYKFIEILLFPLFSEVTVACLRKAPKSQGWISQRVKTSLISNYCPNYP